MATSTPSTSDSGGGPLVAVMGDGFEGAKEKVVAACASTRRGHHMEAVGAALVAARLDWPVTRWIADAVSLRSRSGKNTPPPLIVGVSGPQGCGKSTLCSALVVGLASLGFSAACVSLDDFYWPAASMPAHFKWATSTRLLTGEKSIKRGTPGTHDIDLCLEVLRNIHQRKESVAVPRYDKSAGGGEGDRRQESDYVDASKLDVFLLEGWTLGFKALPDHELRARPLSPGEQEEMVLVNESLKSYEAVYDFVDQWLVMKIEHMSWVYAWRRQQEEDTRRDSGNGLVANEVNAFVDRMLPTYATYLPGLYAHPPLSGESPKKKLCLTIVLNEDRSLKAAAFDPTTKDYKKRC